METIVVDVKVPEGANIILGQSHFIKTVEDIHEAIVNSVPAAKFGIAFCESSGPCLVRKSGNDEELTEAAGKAALALSSGHCFVVMIKEAYPINVLDRIKSVPEVCGIYAATANRLQVIVVETDQGRGILGVVDGLKSSGVESQNDVEERKRFLRNIGYKL